MAEGLILEFEGMGREQYLAIGKALGIDMPAGSGNFPPGLKHHAAGGTPGGWVMFEVCNAQESY